MHQFDPDEVFEVAQHLMTREGEGSGRSAASRAYYAVFLVARDLAGIHAKSSDVHRQTHDHYAELGERQIADGLREPRLRRNDADYLTERLFSRSDVVLVMKRARLVRAALHRFAGLARHVGSSIAGGSRQRAP